MDERCKRALPNCSQQALQTSWKQKPVEVLIVFIVTILWSSRWTERIRVLKEGVIMIALGIFSIIEFQREENAISWLASENSCKRCPVLRRGSAIHLSRKPLWRILQFVGPSSHTTCLLTTHRGLFQLVQCPAQATEYHYWPEMDFFSSFSRSAALLVIALTSLEHVTSGEPRAQRRNHFTSKGSMRVFFWSLALCMGCNAL